MPPGPAYNWLCVLYSASEILGNAARYRSAQIAGTTRPITKRRRYDVGQDSVTSTSVELGGTEGEEPTGDVSTTGATDGAQIERTIRLEPSVDSSTQERMKVDVPVAKKHRDNLEPLGISAALEGTCQVPEPITKTSNPPPNVDKVAKPSPVRHDIHCFSLP